MVYVHQMVCVLIETQNYAEEEAETRVGKNQICCITPRKKVSEKHNRINVVINSQRLWQYTEGTGPSLTGSQH